MFLFLPDPLARLKKLARALKPGGRIALQDYHRPTMALYPRPRDWDAFLAADAAFFATQGGDASVGGRLPQLYRAAGLRPLEARAHLKTGFPGSPEWNWVTEYFLGVMPRLAGLGGFTPAAAEALDALARRFPDGRVRVERDDLPDALTLARDEAGAWVKGRPVSTFPLLDAVRRVGTEAPVLSASFARAREALSS